MIEEEMTGFWSFYFSFVLYKCYSRNCSQEGSCMLLVHNSGNKQVIIWMGGWIYGYMDGLMDISNGNELTRDI